MLAHILNVSDVGCNAFLGGIASNFNSNFVSHESSDWTVIEADEFDRSFLQLSPECAIVTSTDADHLDIYGDDDEFQQGFRDYMKCVNPKGFVVAQSNVELDHPNLIRYGVESGEGYSAMNLRHESGKFMFDIRTPEK